MPLQPMRRKPTYRVRVWFGDHVVVEHLAEPATAERFEAVMRRRFASLRVTDEPLVRKQR
jgi:hypothetical protein